MVRGRGIFVCFVGLTAMWGGARSSSQDPSAAAAEIRAALGQEEIPAMVSIPPWDLPSDLSDFTIHDLYKHIHHAYMGPGHAIPSKQAAESTLKAEWSELGETRSEERLLESLVRGSPFVRVHLRPYRDLGGSAGGILRAFLLSAEIEPDSASFVSVWHQMGEAIAAGRLPFEPYSFDSLDAAVRADGYPAIHHSERFLRAHRPAYRVLGRMEADRLLEQLNEGETDR